MKAERLEGRETGKLGDTRSGKPGGYNAGRLTD